MPSSCLVACTSIPLGGGGLIQTFRFIFIKNNRSFPRYFVCISTLYVCRNYDYTSVSCLISSLGDVAVGWCLVAGDGAAAHPPSAFTPPLWGAI